MTVSKMRTCKLFLWCGLSRRLLALSVRGLSLLVGAQATVSEAQPVSSITAPIEGRAHSSQAFVASIQIALDRAGFSVGEIDGRLGRNTMVAIREFQLSNHIVADGVPNSATQRMLRKYSSKPFITKVFRATQVRSGFAPLPLGIARREKLSCLCFETATEMIAEHFHAAPQLLQSLNLKAWNQVGRNGGELVVPNIGVDEGSSRRHAARLVINFQDRFLQALDKDGAILFHAPVSLGKHGANSLNRARVVRVVRSPSYLVRPEITRSHLAGSRAILLPPGPNSPVGEVWIALSIPHVGIHGNAHPETIGYASSHGCVRLTNWDALRLAKLVSKNVLVEAR